MHGLLDAGAAVGPMRNPGVQKFLCLQLLAPTGIHKCRASVQFRPVKAARLVLITGSRSFRTCTGWALVNRSAVALAGGTLWACEAKAACQCVCGGRGAGM